MKHKKWSVTDINKLKALKKEGYTVKQISDIFNVSKECIAAVCHYYNIRVSFRWSPKKINELRNMVIQGLTYKQIGDKFGVNDVSVRNAINRHKLNKENKEMSNSIALRKQAEELLKAASEMEERENFNKNKQHFRNKLNEIINDYDHLGEKIDELKEMLK